MCARSLWGEPRSMLSSAACTSVLPPWPSALCISSNARTHAFVCTPTVRTARRVALLSASTRSSCRAATHPYVLSPKYCTSARRCARSRSASTFAGTWPASASTTSAGHGGSALSAAGTTIATSPSTKPPGSVRASCQPANAASTASGVRPVIAALSSRTSMHVAVGLTLSQKHRNTVRGAAAVSPLPSSALLRSSSRAAHSSVQQCHP